MDTVTLKTFLRNMTRGRKNAYVDVIPSDGLEHLVISPFREVFLIVNSKPSSHPGEHWICMHMLRKPSGKFKIYFLCSYGLGVEFYGDHFKNFVNTHETIQNTVQLQSHSSAVCGEYCLFFLYYRMKGCCPMAIYCQFTSNTRLNDARIRRFVSLKKSLLRGKVKDTINNQCCTKF
jgi:hypothetical protein